MAKKVELTSEKNYIGDGKYRSDDGLVYATMENHQYAGVGCADDARETLVCADIPQEVVIDGKEYLVLTTLYRGFAGCYALEKVSFPPKMQLIRNETFLNSGLKQSEEYNDRKIKQVVLNGCLDLENKDSYLRVEQVEYDSMNTFLKTKAIIGGTVIVDGKEVVDLVIPEGITDVRKEIMRGSTNLKSVTLPSSIKTISENAFQWCKNLEKINLPEGLEIINSYAFDGCGALKEISFPSTLRAIGYGALKETAISEAIIPNGCKIYDGCFEGCKQLKTVVLPENMTEIPNNAFVDCSLETIDLPVTIKSIGGCAFANTNLTRICLPDGLQNIGYAAFKDTKLTEITLPSSLTLIDEGVFDGCDKLSNVYSKIPDPATCEVKSFELSATYHKTYGGEQVFYRQATLHIPNVKGLAPAYKKKSAWKKFSNIVADL